MSRSAGLLLLVMALGACATTPQSPPVLEGPAGDLDHELDLALLQGEITLQRNEMVAAAEYYARAAQRSDNPDIAQRATAVAFQAGLEALALESAERWQWLAPDSLAANRYVGALRLRRGDVEGAADALGEVLLRADDLTVAFDELLTILSGEERRRSAAAVMGLLAKDYPDEPMAQFALARLSLMAARPRQALEAAELLQALDPQWPRGRLTYAQALLANGETEQAVALASEMMAQERDTDLRLELSGLLMAAGLEDQAREHLQALLAENPGDEDILRALALVNLRSGDLEASEALWNDLRQGFRHQNEAYYYLGRIARENGRTLAAIRNLSRVTTGPQAIEAQVLVALIYEESGDLDSALRHLADFGNASPRHTDAMRMAQARLLVDARRDDEALALFDAPLQARPDDAQLSYARASVYALICQRQSDDGDVRAALATYRVAVAAHPDEPLLRYQRALLYERTDQVRRAIRELERLVEQDPESPVFLNALGYTLADRTRQYARARTLIEQALERAPDNPAIIDSMGWVLFRLGDYEGALEYLQHAWSLMRDPEVAAHIIEVRLARGEHDEALEMLRTALEKWPEDRHLQPWRERLMP
ncbi:MAG: tetratricopeptide repeat protein [Gammaproteobacteria bacterium]|nr:tetratricopeptide repeat protein [Gammaproteobacteria bacterium]